MASSTASETKFSEAIISSCAPCRRTSLLNGLSDVGIGLLKGVHPMYMLN